LLYCVDISTMSDMTVTWEAMPYLLFLIMELDTFHQFQLKLFYITVTL